MSLTSRRITLQFTLGQGDFGSAGQDTVTLEGLRCSVNIVRGGLYGGQADVQVWGMSLDLMNRLTVTQKFFFEGRPNNALTISAGDEAGTSVCFTGGILEAWADGRQQPDVMFHVTAVAGLVDLSQPISATSFRGGVDAALAIQQIAGQIGYAFENSGVQATLTNPYKPGSAKAQIESICRDVDCKVDFDETRKVVAIWPKGAARQGSIIEISPATGLVGYPAFSQGGIQITTLYNPALEFGRKFRLKSQFEPANGEWEVYGLAHRLEANVPGGQWFSDIQANYLEFAQ
ncbi:baseplate hub protein [Novosphingobium olei]|uniref:Uncharacterized protein n=1 Tax=Novosphingobium olei TaxID=2728851 RepID=A0A7Y0BNZ1_9SPHN|nr:hypothetical protein [Novosphingobium olei]NML93809.1 hypothetical protein [Novosphingobium olei]